MCCRASSFSNRSKRILVTMATRLQCLIIIGVCLHAGFSHGHPCEPLPEVRDPVQYGVKVVTYGEPCQSARYLPFRIEKPLPGLVKECVSTPYQPLKLNYQTIQPISRPVPLRTEYPISVEVPEVKPPTVCQPDPYRGKSYGYSIQTPPPPRVPIYPNYNLHVQVLPPTPTIRTQEEPVKLLKGLTGRIDRVLVPACDRPSCSCSSYAV